MESPQETISRLQLRISEIHSRNAALRFPCEHPLEFIVDVIPAEGGDSETCWVEWCRLCGAYRTCWLMPAGTTTDWRLPHREQVNKESNHVL